MRFLIIAQDLRISGTSEGIVSRSFISFLRKSYPKSTIDLVYLKCHKGDDDIATLPIDSTKTFVISRKIPFVIKIMNKIYWRLFHYSLKDDYIQKQFRKRIKAIELENYDHIFIRSSGQEYETILGAYKLPHLKKAIINFHDPYPVFWDTGSNITLSGLELFRLKKMKVLVQASARCISPSNYLSRDMTMLYGSNKLFYTLPHVFDIEAFNINNVNNLRSEKAKITITYHGTLQLGRDMDIVLDAYIKVINTNPIYKEITEFVLRLKSNQYDRLKHKYKAYSNILFLPAVSFLESLHEQKYQSDIILILENKYNYSNILPGKVAVIAGLGKRFLSISPENSEMRRLLEGTNYIASSKNIDSISDKIELLIVEAIHNNAFVSPIKKYFGVDNFKLIIDNLLKEKASNL